MNDLISRQAAIEYLVDNMTWYDEDGYEADEDYKRECITELINGVPSAQPEIIRCKECKHSEHWYSDKLRCFLWAETGIDVFDDGFCNYAERRADDDELHHQF